MNGAVRHAYLNVREKGFSIPKAALRHRLAKSTLHDLLSCPIPNKKGKPAVLTDFEEGVLAALIQGHELFGIALSSGSFLGIARKYTEKKRNVPPLCCQACFQTVLALQKFEESLITNG